MASNLDWTKVRARVDKVSPEWVWLGDDMKRTIANTLMRGGVTAMRGLEITTRNKHVDKDGTVLVTIYVRKA